MTFTNLPSGSIIDVKVGRGGEARPNIPVRNDCAAGGGGATGLTLQGSNEVLAVAGRHMFPSCRPPPPSPSASCPPLLSPLPSTCSTRAEPLHQGYTGLHTHATHSTSRTVFLLPVAPEVPVLRSLAVHALSTVWQRHLWSRGGPRHHSQRDPDRQLTEPLCSFPLPFPSCLPYTNLPYPFNFNLSTVLARICTSTSCIPSRRRWWRSDSLRRVESRTWRRPHRRRQHHRVRLHQRVQRNRRHPKCTRRPWHKLQGLSTGQPRLREERRRWRWRCAIANRCRRNGRRW